MSDHYADLANYRKKIDEARTIMHTNPNTGLAKTKVGFKPWLAREPALPTYGIVPRAPREMYSWLAPTKNSDPSPYPVRSVERYLQQQGSKDDVTSKRKRSDSPQEGPSRKK